MTEPAMPQTNATTRHDRPAWLALGLLGVLLVAIVVAAGINRLDAPFVQGDEYLFIVNNPDVTGGNPPVSLLERVVRIFQKTHGDLYQPLPIATYAIEWSIADRDRVAYVIRRDDLILHAINALLVWSILIVLLRRLVPNSPTDLAVAVAWLAAGLWALHPALVRAWACDMGRTHLLSGLFSLTAMRLYLAYLETRRQKWWTLAILALVLAMLSKPVAGWFLIALLFEWVYRGLRAALLSMRTWATLAVCVGFALLTLYTSRQAGLLEDIGGALFGDPITRSLLAAWLYVRDTFWPIHLPIWYMPDIQVGWSYAPVWLGAGVLGLSAAAALVFLLHPRSRLIGGGILWYWGNLAPVLGFVGARFSSAGDRYLYQPLFGLILAAATAAASARRQRVVAPVLGGIGIVLMGLMSVESYRFAGLARDMLGRARTVVSDNPGDPRAYEMLGVAYTFCADHPEAGDGREPGEYAVLAIGTLTQAGDLAWKHPEYFRNDKSRADFLRRLSYTLHKLDALPESVAQARRAFELVPDSPENCTRFAHACRAAGDYDEALIAYRALEKCMPADPVLRTKRYTEYGDLLLYISEDPAAAIEKYRKAIEPGSAPDRAYVGLARCEVLVGNGAEGLRIAREVNLRSPERVDALLVIALYHLTSHDWTEADRVYRMILARWPTNYEALRGFQEVCANTGTWADAAAAWYRALEKDQNNQAFASYLAWSLACASDPQAAQVADRLLTQHENDRFACYAHMLLALRAGRVDDALNWIARAGRGEPLPKARESLRADKTLEILLDRGELPPEAMLARAAIRSQLHDTATATELLEIFLTKWPDSPAAATAKAMLAGEMPARSGARQTP